MTQWTRTGRWPGVRRGMQRGPGGAFTLESLTPSLHLAARLTEGFADGAAVDGLVEPYTGLVFGNAAGAAQPTFQTNEINGFPIFRFDGSDDALLTDTQILGSALFQANAATVYLIYKFDSTDADGVARPFSWGSAADNEIGMWGPFSDNNLYFDYGSVAAGGRISGAQPGGFDDAFHVVELWRSGGDAEITVDGVLAASGTMTDDLDVTQSAGVAIGTSETAGSAAKMDIAEVLFVARALSAGQRAKTRGFFFDLYAIPPA